ncbi:MAG TPA: hypothetical protein VHE30_25770 [Polyangiaceae bacterium]|nr:hypothetical protein [Polyangiaceae bacterium]
MSSGRASGLCVALALFARSALADAVAPMPSGGAPPAPPPASAPHAAPRSDYEEESVREALALRHAEVDPNPEGKVVEGIDVVSLEVFEKRDPLPGFLNSLHTTTRRTIIDREVLLRPGDVWDRALVEETERNLRVRQLSVVIIVPVLTKDPKTVRLLVVAKDVWSLRVNWDVAAVADVEFHPPWVLVNGRVQTLVLQPSEENLGGRHKTVLTNVVFERPTYTLGVGYVDPRIGGSHLSSSATANVVMNCRSGSPEGTYGTFSYGRPLYSTHTKWAWVTAASWAETVVRPGGTLGESICSDDTPVSRRFATADGTVYSVPYSYRQDVFRSQVSATRSFGVATKNELSFGLESNRRRYSAEALPGVPDVVENAFVRRYLPVSDTRISPFIQLHAFQNRFLRVLDLETLGLQEDFRLGHDVWLKVYPAWTALGSTRTFVGTYSGLGYTLPLGDGLVRVLGASTIQLGSLAKTDAEVEASGRVVSPRLPFGRVIVDATMLDRYRNHLNPISALGGTGRLRGYRSLAFTGPEYVAANVEIRSRPVRILSVMAGAVAFYDVGDAFSQFSEMRLKQGAGGGFRFAFPQIQRSVFRIDAGVPLTRNEPLGEFTIVAQFEQAFGVPALAAPGLVP